MYYGPLARAGSVSKSRRAFAYVSVYVCLCVMSGCVHGARMDAHAGLNMSMRIVDIEGGADTDTMMDRDEGTAVSIRPAPVEREK